MNKQVSKRKVNLRKLRWDRIGMLIIIIGIITISIYGILTKPKLNPSDEKVSYIVSKGDTLWSISEQIIKDNDLHVDPREIIYLIKSDNSINSELQIGQEILIRANY